MKYLILLSLCACAPQPDGVNSLSLPIVSPSPISTTPSPIPTPSTATQPSISPLPQPSLSPSPSPSPQANPVLTCYNNTGIFCTGSNLGSSIVQIDIDLIFTANDPRLSVHIDSIGYDLFATTHTSFVNSANQCPQPYTAGCYQHSICLNADIYNSQNNTHYKYTWCGNQVKPSNNTLESL